MSLRPHLLLCIVINSLFAPAAVSNPVTLSSTLSECDRKSSILFCDFKNMEKDIHMEPLTDKEIQKVFIYNAKNVYLNETTCVNIALQNINKISVLPGQPTACSDMELAVKLSTIDRLPDLVTKLYLEESSMDSIITNKNISKLTVINSNIKVIDIKTPIEADTAILQNSKIDSLEKLVIGNTSIVFHNTEIKAVKTGGIVLQSNAKATFKNSIMKTIFDNSFTLIAGALLTIENSTGILNIMGASNSPSEGSDIITATRGDYYVPFILFFILFLLSLIFNILFLLCHLKIINIKQGITNNVESNSKEKGNEGMELRIKTDDKGTSKEINESQSQPLLSSSSPYQQKCKYNNESDAQNSSPEIIIGKTPFTSDPIKLQDLKTKVAQIRSELDEKQFKKKSLRNDYNVRIKEVADNLTKDHANAQKSPKLNKSIKFTEEKMKCNEKIISQYNKLIEDTIQAKSITLWQEAIFSISSVINCSLNSYDCKESFIIPLKEYLEYIKPPPEVYRNEQSKCSNTVSNNAEKMSAEELSVMSKIEHLEEVKNNQESYLESFDNILRKLLDFGILLITILGKEAVTDIEIAQEA